jgi:hypothetical protein
MMKVMSYTNLLMVMMKKNKEKTFEKFILFLLDRNRMNKQGSFQKRKHPCDTINIIPNSLQQTHYSIQFKIDITSFTPCNYVIRIIEKASNKEIKDVVFSESRGIYTIRFENLVPGTDYWVVFYNLFNNKLTQLDYIDVTTAKLVNTCGQINIVQGSLRTTPFTVSFNLNITSDVRCHYRISAVNTRMNTLIHTQVSLDKGIHPILFHSLTANTEYRIDFAIWNGNKYENIPFDIPLIIKTQQFFRAISSTDSTIDLTFTLPLQGSYTVNWKRADDIQWLHGQAIALSPQTQLPIQYQIPNLLMGEDYTVYVEYTSGGDQNGQSEVVQIRTKEPTIIIVNDEATFDSITVDFSVNSSDGEYSIGYKLDTQPDTSYVYFPDFIPYNSQQEFTTYTINNLQMDRTYSVVIVYRKNGKIIYQRKDIDTLAPGIIIGRRRQRTDTSIAFEITLPKQGIYRVVQDRTRFAGQYVRGHHRVYPYIAINNGTIMPILFQANNLSFDAVYEFTVEYYPNGLIDPRMGAIIGDSPVIQRVVAIETDLPFYIDAVNAQKSSAKVILAFYDATDVVNVDEVIVRVTSNVDITKVINFTASVANGQLVKPVTSPNLISFDIGGLDENTEYTLNVTPIINRPGLPKPIRRYKEEIFTTKYRRCTFRKDKVEVVSNRMKYSLNFSKIDHILRKLFQKMVTHFIESSLNKNNINIRNTNWVNVKRQLNELTTEQREQIEQSKQLTQDAEKFQQNKFIAPLQEQIANLEADIQNERGKPYPKQHKIDKWNNQIIGLEKQIEQLSKVKPGWFYKGIKPIVKRLDELKQEIPPLRGRLTAHSDRRLALYENVFNQVRDFLRVHPGYKSPDTPLHIELYYLLLSEPRKEEGDTRRFLNQFFPGMDAHQRYEYFNEGFPGGGDEFRRFAKSLLANPAEEDHILNYVLYNNGVFEDARDEPFVLTQEQIDAGYTTQLSPRKREPPLRAILRGPNYRNDSYGFIFLSDKPSSRGGRGVKDDMLVHLTIFNLFENPATRTGLYEARRNGERVPVTYHTTDSCFDLHNFYKFEDGIALHRAGDRNTFVENDDGSVTFFHQNPDEANRQQTTIQLDDNSQRVTTNGPAEGGGRYKKTRKVKVSKKRKSMRARKIVRKTHKGKISKKRKTMRGRRG